MCRKTRNEPNWIPGSHFHLWRTLALAKDTRLVIMNTQDIGPLYDGKSNIKVHYVQVVSGAQAGASGWLCSNDVISLDGAGPIPESRRFLLSKRFGLAGFTYKIDGNDLYLIHRDQSVVVRTSPGRTAGISPCPGLGPNKAIVSGWFKYKGNAEGTNGYGAK